MDGRFYLLAFLAIGVAMCFYYNIDMLQTLENNLEVHPYFLTTSQFNMLYFSTYIAQFLFLLPLGILIDHFPIKILMPIMVIITIITEIIIGFLVKTRVSGYETMMCVARGIFGISGLGIIIIQGKLANRFAKHHYEYMMGLCLNVPYMFNAINSFITSAVAEQTDDLSGCFFIGAGFGAVALVIAFAINACFLQPAEESRVES